jgi:hypothetical protein
MIFSENRNTPLFGIMLRGRQPQFGLARIDWKIGAICLQHVLMDRRGGLQRLVCRPMQHGGSGR